MFTALASIWLSSESAPSSAPNAHVSTIYVFTIATVVTLILLALQWRFEYRKRTYEPTWGLKFVDDFFSRDMRHTRRRAAEALKPNLSNTAELKSSDLDEVIDFFEQLGFYMRGDQITPEVAHHSFHYWICGYYSAAKDYIGTVRKTNVSSWEHVELLFEMTHEIEVERTSGQCDKFSNLEQINRFLDEEMRKNPPDDT
jgi:hypothetical protein